MGEIAIRELRKKLEKAQKEKDGIQLNVEKFKHASKSLNKLIDCQIVENYKKELGYKNYNAVLPPYIGIFMPPTPDLSFTGLDEFANKPVVKNYKAKSSEEEPKVVTKNDDAPIIEEWVSDNKEEEVSQPKIGKKTVKPSIAKIEVNHQNFAKKTYPCAKRNMVPRAVLMKSGLESINTARQVNDAHPKQQPKAVANAVKRNNSNAVKASACWVWKLKHKVLDDVSKHNCASVTLKKFDYIDTQGRSKCSRHMTWNMSYLTDYEEMDGGYVTFGGNPKGGKITRKEEKAALSLFIVKKMYCLVVTDDYSRFTWVFFQATKDETSGILKSFITMIENLVDHKVKVIRCDNGSEFKIREINQFCKMKEAVNTACYMQNRVLVVKPHNKTPYELFHGRTSTLSFMRPFRCPVTILNTIDHLGKFNGKANEGTQSNGFAGTKASYNAGQARKKTEPVKDYILLQLWIADPPFSQDPKSSHDDGSKPLCDDEKKVDEDPRKQNECDDQEKEDNVNNTNNVNTVSSTVNVAGTNEDNELPFDPNMLVLEYVSTFNFSSDDEDDGAMADMKNLDTTIQVSPILTTIIHKDHPLDQVIRDLQSAIQTRNMSKNLEEHGFEESKKVNHALKDLSWIEAIQEELLQFKLQENEKEVYVCQPLGFEDLDFSDRVYKVEKALYGLHQAPRARYETMSTYLLDNGFQREKIDKTLFIKMHKGDILLVQVYVDDISFGSTKKELCNAFQRFTEVKNASTPMKTQKPLLKDEDGEEVDVYMYRYLKGQPKLGRWYPKYSPFDLIAYTNSDYAGSSLDRKSTTGACQFLGCRLISWQCKKQTMVANSTTKAKYVAGSSCCGQVEDDKEMAKLKQLMEIILDKEEVAIDAILLAIKSPRIVDCKIHKKEEKSYYQIVRADGKSQMYMVFKKRRKHFAAKRAEEKRNKPPTQAQKRKEESGTLSNPGKTILVTPTIRHGKVTQTLGGVFRLWVKAQAHQLSPITHPFLRLNHHTLLLHQFHFHLYPLLPFPTVTQPDTTPIIQYSRRARIAQTSAFLTVADEPTSPVRDDSQGEACPTDSGFVADQDRATIAKSSTLHHDSAPRVTSHAANEGKEIARVLTSMDAATVLAGETDVPTGSGFIPTAGPPATVISTGSEVGPTAKLEEQQEREDMRMNEQIAKDAEVARIHAEEEIQGMIDSLDKSNETIAKYLHEYQEFASELPLEKKIELISDLVKYQEHYTKVHKFQSQQRKPMSKKQKREYYMAVIKSNLGWRFKDFKEGQRSYWQIIRLGGSSACYQFFVDLLRQLYREDLNQLWALVKEYLSIRPASSDKEKELWVELKRMYEPDHEDQLWTLTQNYMHAPVEWKLYDLSGVHHVTAKDKEIFMLVEKDYPLRRGLALVMINYRLQVKNYSQIAEDLLRKIYYIANTPRKQSD
nr:hypothetical protein [Tanacetum cinerariifolium]